MPDEFPVTVTAEVYEGKPDPSASAGFANTDRAVQYAQLLVSGGGYSGVFVADQNGGRFPVS